MFFEYRANSFVCDGGDSWDASFPDQLVGDSLRVFSRLAVRDVNGNALKDKKKAQS